VVFSPGTLVSSTNKIDHHDIAELLLKVALNITLTKNSFVIPCTIGAGTVEKKPLTCRKSLTNFTT
jgi:hypothetical protein